jgi:hypothetical protein
MRPFSRLHPRRAEEPRTPVADGLAVIEILSEGTVRHD